MTTTINRVFKTEIVRNRNTRFIACQYFVLDADPALVGRFGRGKTYLCKTAAAWSKVFEHSTGDSKWISPTTAQTRDLLRAASVYRASRHGSQKVLGDLLMLQSPNVESLPALRALFRNIVGEVGGFKLLPHEELTEVLLAPKDEARDVFIGGLYDPATGTLSLTRGNFETLVVPLSIFRPSGSTKPAPALLDVADYGHTIKLGDYEASADGILYEADPDYRRRVHARRRQQEKGFGPSLRRLRLQRQVKRGDFPGLSSKTIARIERGESGKPHGRTLNILASCLGVTPKEIETY